ncbi:hypothetical protein [Micromonospora sp. NBS 11-29]|uniref:hypothetical protein n=1 Tax=Micromonospora sp. NBS 11-29 TaxID=1960879 RepID=UPI003F90838F
MTLRSRSGWALSFSALAQLSRCTVTPPERVTKPNTESGGTGVQQRANLMDTSLTPRTTTPGSLLDARSCGNSVATAVSAMSSAAPSLPP